ncbi:hypothetical protein BO85DRAFT_208543 [Aspergillus piperis CBS 112811]|uniref:Uncharacterized protein n=1 Tax=Aspergillus piperis CBS 112811 TaxID=1448313 RepID=A0A8G1QRB0_9EURO|nr:hypothetical protein BO85DRAFT_208543 [Aspergillus piperis CBS 112811]RAH52157.1 hypothetical protein BO85DRAFT_208543 [Aspergillus piperis CBS 112811]
MVLFFILLSPLIFVSWRALAAVGIQLEDRGDVSLAWIIFPGDPAAGISLLCLLVCRQAVLACMQCFETAYIRRGLVSGWLPGWLPPLLLSGRQDRMAGWSRRDVAARYGGDFACMAFCAAMGWVVVRFTLDVDDYVECMSLCRKRQIISIYLHGVRNSL